MPTRGIDKVKRNYRIAIKEICEKRTFNAIYSVLSQGGAMAAQMTPIDTANLINSQYAPQITLKGTEATGRIGYTAFYAFFVHEASGKLAGEPRADGNSTYWSPNAEPKFLEKGFEQILPAVPEILKRAYAI